MLSIVIPTHESERIVVRTLSCLVPGVVAGCGARGNLADSGSGDGTEQVADVAGCRFMTVTGFARNAASDRWVQARGPWLRFLRPGSVLESAWTAEVERFWMLASEEAGAPKAAMFQPEAYRGQSLERQMMSLITAGGRRRSQARTWPHADENDL